MYAGPRVRVRRGRREMLPGVGGKGRGFLSEVIKRECWGEGVGREGTDYADVGILEKDGVICLWIL